MGDVVFVSVVIAFFALMVGFVALCDRVVGGVDEDDDAGVDGDMTDTEPVEPLV